MATLVAYFSTLRRKWIPLAAKAPEAGAECSF